MIMSFRGEAAVTLKMISSHAINFKFHASIQKENKTQITRSKLNQNLRISTFK